MRILFSGLVLKDIFVITKAECKHPESLINDVIMAGSSEKHVNQRKRTEL